MNTIETRYSAFDPVVCKVSDAKHGNVHIKIQQQHAATTILSEATIVLFRSSDCTTIADAFLAAARRLEEMENADA